MMTENDTGSTPQVAVWYFVGATFLFAAPVLFFADADPWVHVVTLVLGFAAIVVGGIHLGREITQWQKKKNAPPPLTSPPPRDDGAP